MPNLLGLSIDVNSIGWTLLEAKTMKIKAMGTRIFPAGSDNYGSGSREVSKQVQRAQFRVKRMRYARKRRRKNFLIKLLVQNEMCPLDKGLIERGAFHSWFDHEPFQNWMRLDPYPLREKAVHEKISLQELGRILYHISNKRGFPLKNREAHSDTNALLTGIPKFNRTGINETKKQMKDKTLGEYLNSLLPEENVSYRHNDRRIRNRFVSRKMYVEEIHLIWDKQASFHPRLHSMELRSKLIGLKDNASETKGAVFYQKPLRSQKHKVGKCIFEPNKSRCCISNLVYQDILAYKWINTLKNNGEVLSSAERQKIYRFFMTHPKFGIQQVKELLGTENLQYNRKTKTMVYGSFLNAKLSSSQIFGPAWFDLSMDQKKEIWHALYFYDNSDKLEVYMQKKWGLGKEESQNISQLVLDTRYAPISEKAAKNILFFLKRGVAYELAVVLGGVKNSLKNVWDNIEENDIQYIITRVVELYKKFERGGFIPKLQEFLLEEMQFSEFQIKKLYGLQAQTLDFSLLKKFPFGAKHDKEINNFKNPLLRNALFQTRKVVNSLIEKYGAMDEIKSELNTNLKTNKFQRYIYRLDQRREVRNQLRFTNKIGAHSENVTPLNLLKMELWEECKGICPYTGEPIPLEILFTEKITVVYIHPWSVSLNDSKQNKTLCYTHFSEQILNRTPFDYYNNVSPVEWQQVVERANGPFSNTLDYPSNQKKFRKFVKRYYQRDYLKNQLDDTHFVSREVACFLSKVCFKVGVASNYTTDHLIRAFSLDHIVEGSVEKLKNVDHRIPALKSYAVAVRNMKFLYELSHRNKYSYTTDSESFPIPHGDFRDEVEYFINSILVSHQKRDRLYGTRKIFFKKGDKTLIQKSYSPRGALHKESVYGKRTPPALSTAFHIRKPLEKISTLNQIDKIVDPIVRSEVLKVFKASGQSENRFINSSKVFFDIMDDGQKATKVFLPNKNGDPVPVNKVRIRVSLNAAVKLKKDIDQYVNLRNNHHVLVYLNEEKQYEEEVVSFWEAIKRKKSGADLYRPPKENCEMITALHINDLYLMGIDDLDEFLEKESRSFLSQHLYRVQKLSSKFYEFRLAFNNRLESTEFPSYIRINNFGIRKTGWLSYNPIKVNLDPIGGISLAKEFKTLTSNKISL